MSKLSVKTLEHPSGPGSGNICVQINNPLLMPNKPIISGRVGNAVNNGALPGPFIIPYDVFFVQGRGITYDPATRRFTVSVTGVYRIEANAFKNSGAGGFRFTIGVNNSAPVAGQVGAIATGYSDSANYDHVPVFAVCPLNAGDYIVFYLQEGALHAPAGQLYSQFSIEMIG